MDNKEVKNGMTELNDEALENVSGGEYQRLLIPILLDDEDETTTGTCATCGIHIGMLKKTYEHRLIDGVFYCNTCRANHIK